MHDRKLLLMCSKGVPQLLLIERDSSLFRTVFSCIVAVFFIVETSRRDWQSRQLLVTPTATRFKSTVHSFRIDHCSNVIILVDAFSFIDGLVVTRPKQIRPIGGICSGDLFTE